MWTPPNVLSPAWCRCTSLISAYFAMSPHATKHVAVIGGVDWCRHGKRGVQTDDVCCSVHCDVCGGLDCQGLCCDSNIRGSGRFCARADDLECIIPQTEEQLTNAENKSFHFVRTGQWKDMTRYLEDPGFTMAIARFLVRENARNLIDIGAGSGAMMRRIAWSTNLSVIGVDGNVDKVKRVIYRRGGMAELHYQDLSMPFPSQFTGFDWALSVGVAEHIFPLFEHTLLLNYHRAAHRGIIMMWAPRNQRGTGHVNCRDKQEVDRIFAVLGFTYDHAASKELQRHARRKTAPWYKETVVYRRTQHKHLRRRDLIPVIVQENNNACWEGTWMQKKKKCCNSTVMNWSRDEADDLFGFSSNVGFGSCFSEGYTFEACCARTGDYNPAELEDEFEEVLVV